MPWGAGPAACWRGAAPMRSWSPDVSLTLSPQARLLLEAVWHDDPLFSAMGTEAVGTA